MTEYRKIEDIREVLFRYAHNEHSKAFSKFLMSEIERKNKPDVVERSKIDKAIEEIRRLSPTPTVNDVIEGNPEKDEIWAFLVAVLNIIEKNLGDEK